jgi:ribosome recycling factor
MFAARILARNVNYVVFHRSYVSLGQKCQNHVEKLSAIPVVTRDALCEKNTSTVIPTRHYAKSKDKKKEKGKSKVAINESELSEALNVESLKNQMQKALDLLKNDFLKHLSVRTNAGSIEGLPIEFDGKTHTLQELAQIVRKNPKMLVVNMSVFPQAIPAALKAIEKSGMNLNPQQDGTTLYIPVPKVTTEHRENLAKSAKTLFIKCRDSIRDVQVKQVKSLKKKDKLSQDTARNFEQQVIAIADGFISEAEKILESKQKELIGKD